MKTYLFIDSKNQSVMMIVAEDFIIAVGICLSKTDVVNNQYTIAGHIDHISGEFIECTI
jgi:hypothetical protein